VKVLVTGHRGLIGSALAAALREGGDEVVGFDLLDGQDMEDAAALAVAAQGCDAIVHAAGRPDDPEADRAVFVGEATRATCRALEAAEGAGVERLIYISSGKALGLVERPPEYLPVDDAHPGRPWRPYGLAKWLGEEMCEAFTRRTGTTTVCLRPVAVFADAEYEALRAAGERPAVPGRPWNLGVFIHLSDVVDAILRSLRAELPRHTRLLLCASEIASMRDTLGLVEERLPEISWRDGDDGRRYYLQNRRAALIDCAPAQRLLGWQPRFQWTGNV
jgi:UDP-glucose 4-epimerase